MDLSVIINTLLSIDFSFLKDYISTDPSVFIIGTGLAAGIGFVAAIVMPLLYKLIQKLIKRELTKVEKRDVVTYVAITASMAIIFSRFNFVGNFWEIMTNILFSFLYFLTAIKGMIQLVYEKIIKAIEISKENKLAS